MLKEKPNIYIVNFACIYISKKYIHLQVLIKEKEFEKNLAQFQLNNNNFF